jgi:ferredoxin
MKIEVEKSACIGAGQCALVAPDIFDQDDEGIVLVLNDSPAESLHVAVQKAVNLCPAKAITINKN